MAKLALSLAISAYDRSAPLLDGRVRVEGCDLVPLVFSPEETFHRAFRFTEFDITEVSLSSHALMVARGDNRYVGIPAFTSRAFRHSAIYIRTDRGISSPGDLRGRLVGMPEYQQTANVWVRGILDSDFDVAPSQVRWRTGGYEETGRGERTTIKLPPDINCEPIPNDRTLSGMLETGELDAVVGPREPSCFTRKHPDIARLFPDYRRAEEDYFKRTGIFPIMHMIGIRRELVERHPWLPVSIYKAFIEAKALALEELGLIGHLAVTLPWPVAELERTRALMGEDFWSYGVAPNRTQIETFLRYSHAQGLCSRPLAVEELFVPSVLDMSRL